MSGYRRYLPVSLIGLVAMLVATPAMAVGPGSRHDHEQIGRLPASSTTAKYVPGRALVQFRPGVTMAGMRGMAARADAAVLREITGRGANARGRLLVVQSKTVTTSELVKALSADPRVRFAEPDYIVRVEATPDDTRFAELWGLHLISAPGAWDLTTGSPDVVIANLDTGVDYTHPDLAANMWHNPGETPANGIDDDGNGYADDIYGIDAANADSDPMDDQGHGTHTSGTAAAVGNNGLGIAGVAWQAKIMALKFLGADGYGSTSDAIACINYAIAQDVAGVNIAAINASWGGGDYSAALRNAINAAGARGIVFVASAGNGGVDNDVTPQYPASYDCANIIAVAATDSSDVLASFSNYGVQSVDVAAPGVSVLSTVPVSVFPFVSYAAWNGTSMAAPHVAGATALCAARHPTETMSQRIARVLDGVDPVPGLSSKTSSGGRLNVQSALAGPGPSDDDVPDDIPGIPLTRSPVTGDIATVGDCDVFSFSAAAGQSMQLSLTGAAGTDIDLYLYTPGASTVVGSGFVGSGSVASSSGIAYPETIAYTASTTGVHFILVHGYDGTGTYQLTHNVDSAPPVTSVIGADSSWHRTPVTLAFSATDAGFGVAYTEYEVDGTGFVRGEEVVVSGNGSHTVAYRSTDKQDNVEAAKTAIVNVDSGRPTTVALANVAVRKGRKATMRFRANDVTPRATVTIKVYKGGKAVKTLRVGRRATNSAQKYSWTCKLAKGRYTWRVYATDLARNRQGRIGYKTLTVK